MVIKFRQNRNKFTKNLDISGKSQEWNRSLQYKVPISAPVQDYEKYSNEMLAQSMPKNVFALRKHGMGFLSHSRQQLHG